MFKKLLIVAVSTIALSGCLTTNQQGGTLIGATTGGLLGSQFGKGNGKLITTALGVFTGAMAGNAVGLHMDQPPRGPATIVYNRQTARAAAPRSNNQCSYIQNDGVRSSCERGLADRNRQIQKEAEQRAYQCSRYGRCY